MLAHIVDEASKSKSGQAHGEVMVLTLHGSQGFQWPVVVTGFPQAREWKHRAVSVQKAAGFRVEEPLAGRSISFLPHVLASFPGMKEAWQSSRVVAAGAEVEKRETARLLYVGLTRARFHGIIAASSPDGQGNALNDAVAGDVPVIEWDEPTEGGPGTVRVHDLRRSEDGAAFADLPITMRAYATAGDSSAWGREVLCKAGARWARWVEATCLGSQILTEQPIAWRNEQHRVMDGWIDTRILLADGGHVLVDHKSYAGKDPLGNVRENYVGQLAVYSATLESTTGGGA